MPAVPSLRVVLGVRAQVLIGWPPLGWGGTAAVQPKHFLFRDFSVRASGVSRFRENLQGFLWDTYLPLPVCLLCNPFQLLGERWPGH